VVLYTGATSSMILQPAALWCDQQLQNPNPSLYDDKLWEAAKGSCTYARTKVAAIVPRLPCTFSAISSMLIIYIILKSPTRLSSTYHRIMLGMSISDLFLTIPSAFTTLLMPSPGDYWTDINNIQGTRMGNTLTCTAQGFFILFGNVSFFLYDFVSLIIFYLCSIGFKMTREKIEKYVEPLIHFMPIVIPFIIAVSPLLQGEYNASIDLPWCVPSPKPWFCKNENNGGVECVKGGSVNIPFPDIGNFISIFTLILLVWRLLCLGLICWKVYAEEKRNAAVMDYYDYVKRNAGSDEMAMKRVGSSGLQKRGGRILIRLEDGRIDTIEDHIILEVDRFKETKIIASQATLYILASVLVSFTCVMYLHLPETQVLYKSVMGFLSNLEGFYNLLIFTFHKVYSMRRCNSNLSFAEAMHKILSGQAQDTFVFSSMDIVVSQQNTLNVNTNHNDKSSDDKSSDDSHTVPFNAKVIFDNSGSIYSESVGGNAGSLPLSSQSNLSAFRCFDNNLNYASTQQNDEESISFLQQHQDCQQNTSTTPHMENMKNLQFREEDDKQEEQTQSSYLLNRYQHM
jgi:hypothetical protein